MKFKDYINDSKSENTKKTARCPYCNDTGSYTGHAIGQPVYKCNKCKGTWSPSSVKSKINFIKNGLIRIN